MISLLMLCLCVFKLFFEVSLRGVLDITLIDICHIRARFTHVASEQRKLKWTQFYEKRKENRQSHKHILITEYIC